MTQINLSGEFLNKYPEIHNFKDMKFDNEAIYKCFKDESGKIVDYEEF